MQKNLLKLILLGAVFSPAPVTDKLLTVTTVFMITILVWHRDKTPLRSYQHMCGLVEATALLLSFNRKSYFIFYSKK